MIIPNRKTKKPRTTGLTVGPNRLAKDSAPRPNAPASKVANPLFIPLLKVAPNEK